MVIEETKDANVIIIYQFILCICTVVYKLCKYFCLNLLGFDVSAPTTWVGSSIEWIRRGPNPQAKR